ARKQVTILSSRRTNKEIVRAIIELRETGLYMLKELLEAAQITKSVFKYWNDRLPEENNKDTALVQALKDIVTERDRRYGYSRVCLALKKRGIIVNHTKVLRLMRQDQLLCVMFKHRNRQYKSYKGTVAKIAKTKLSRRCKTGLPYQKLLT